MLRIHGDKLESEDINTLYTTQSKIWTELEKDVELSISGLERCLDK